MRYASREPSHGFHFLRLPELVFEHTPFGNIFGNDLQNFVRFLRASDGAATKSNRDRIPVFSFPPYFNAVQPAAASEFMHETGLFFRMQKNITHRIEREHFFSRVVGQHSNQG